jgi:hypothetical protein
MCDVAHNKGVRVFLFFHTNLKIFFYQSFRTSQQQLV